MPEGHLLPMGEISTNIAVPELDQVLMNGEQRKATRDLLYDNSGVPLTLEVHPFYSRK